MQPNANKSSESGAGLADTPDYETKSQVARRLSVSKRTIDNLMRQRRLPFVKLSSKIVRFPKAEVDDYIRRNLTIHAHGHDGGQTV